MVSRLRALMFVVGLSVLATGCVIRSGGQPGGTVVQGGGAPATFTVLNQSGGSICYVQMTQTADWGGDWLGSSERIDPGMQRDFSMTEGSWNVQFLDCNQQPIFRRYSMPITSPGITLTYRVYEVN